MAPGGLQSERLYDCSTFELQVKKLFCKINIVLKDTNPVCMHQITCQTYVSTYDLITVLRITE